MCSWYAAIWYVMVWYSEFMICYATVSCVVLCSLVFSCVLLSSLVLSCHVILLDRLQNSKICKKKRKDGLLWHVEFWHSMLWQ